MAQTRPFCKIRRGTWFPANGACYDGEPHWEAVMGATAIDAVLSIKVILPAGHLSPIFCFFPIN
jgi:hypothetical protein